jgi:hypothetical protein
MKLSPSQIEYINHYVVSKDIKWYELQMELTDHLVMETERIWEQSPELSFHQVMNQAERLFGRNGFKEIENERTEILRKQYRKQHFTLVKEYLKFPKIVLSFFAVILIYKMSFYFEIASYMTFFSVILFVFSVVSILNWYRNRKINGNSFLSIETAYLLNNSSVTLAYFSLIGSKNLAERMDENHFRLLPFCVLYVFGILFIFTGRHLTNSIIREIKKQYLLN